MSSIREASCTIKIVEIEERAVVYVIKIVVVKGIIFIAGISSPVQVRQRFDVVLAIGWIAVRQDVGLLLVDVTFVELAHHLVQSDVIFRRSGASRNRRPGRTVLILVPVIIFVPVFVLVIVAAATDSVATTAHVAASAIAAGAAAAAVTPLHRQCYLRPNFHARRYSPILVYPTGGNGLNLCEIKARISFGKF